MTTDPARTTLYHAPDLARFYDHGPSRRLDYDYCRRMAIGTKSILDLGCGTGGLASSLADGRFVFDTRNPHHPAPKARMRSDAPHRLSHPELGAVEAWNESRYDEATGILTYENGYRVLDSGEVFSGKTSIRYTARKDLAALIAQAGLCVDTWLGDWDGSGFEPTSREIIPIGRLAYPIFPISPWS